MKNTDSFTGPENVDPTGYGDIVLPPDWRLVGGVEALTGILMCGWSTGFFFAVVIRLSDFLRRESDGGAAR